MIAKEAGEDLHQYITDEANNKGKCEKVFIVENKSDVIEVVISANKLSVPLTVSGNHTSLTGSSVPLSGWVIATERLNKVIEINPTLKYAVVEPGVTLNELQEALKPFHLFFPPDPTETSCFIGGMVGTNASGARSFKYGATRDFIEAIEIVLADGTVLNLERGARINNNLFELLVGGDKKIAFMIPGSYTMPDVKNTVGYYLKNNMEAIDLFIGAEGTLGVITSIKLKLVSISPSLISLVVFFDDLDNSFKFLDKLRTDSKNNCNQKNADGIMARLIEFFDQKSLALLNTHIPGIPAGSVAALWIEQECADENQYFDLLAKWEEFINQFNVSPQSIWLGADERDRNKISAMRHLLPTLVNDLVKRNGMKKMGTDVSVPDEAFEIYYKRAIKQVEDNGIDYVAFGHFGNSHLHLNMLPHNSEQKLLSQNIYTYLCSEAIKLGGTFSAEHGVGKTKKHYMELMLQTSNINFMKNVKLKFDPNNIMGYGNLF